MKKIVVLALITFLAGSAFAAKRNPKSSRQEIGINGNAIYVIEYTYNLHGGKDNGRQLICIDSITFDKRGNFQDKFRTKDGSYTWYSYYFDVNGYSLGWNEYNREKQLTGRTAYLNDKNGNRIERTIYMGQQMTKREASRFENNRKVEEQSFAPNGMMTEKRVYKYDEYGNNTELEFYNRDGELIQRYLYKYDENGNRIEWRYYDADEFLVALTTYYYDDHNNLTEVSSFNYDEHLNWKHSYIYEYDEDDNWVRQTIYRNNVPYQVIEREIAFPAY
ncbi:MAG: hypothetical protein II793_02595 [Bacteroidales bacterium]|nr:hypothetical protein [Bacteroidales bacterium]